MHVPSLQAATGRVAAYVACASIPVIIGAGCVVGPFQADDNEVEVLTGTDSAGATVEITKQKDSPSKARVSDIVLGEGEAAVTQDADRLTFTITFPAGVMITYAANVAAWEPALPDIIEGTWVQHAGGIFGEDAGTWAVKRESASGP